MLLSVLYCILAAVTMAASIYCLVLYFRRRKQKNLVCDNSSFFLMDAFGLAFGATVLYLVMMGEWQLSHIPAVVCLICLLGLFSWNNDVIVFDEDGFTRRDLFLRSSRHSYQDITDCRERILKQTRKRKEVQTLFYIGSKCFPLSPKAANYEEFAMCVRKYGRDGIAP